MVRDSTTESIFEYQESILDGGVIYGRLLRDRINWYESWQLDSKHIHSCHYVNELVW